MLSCFLAFLCHLLSSLLSRCHHLRDTTLRRCCLLRHFQLVTDGYPLSRTNELRKIGVESMIWESCHCQRFAFIIFAPIALRQRNTQYVGSLYRIILVGLVEITAAKQKNGIRMLFLQVKILLDKGRDSSLDCLFFFLLFFPLFFLFFP